MCPQRLSGPPAGILPKWVKWLKYKKRSRYIHHFKSDSINNLIWTICAFRVQNPHQWFLAKQSSLKSWKEMSQKYQRSWNQKGCLVINPQNYNFNKFQHWKLWCSQNATNQLKSNVELGYMCPRGHSGPPAVTLTKWLKCCVHARYMKVQSFTVSTYKRRMEKKLGEKREKWGTMHRLVAIFGTVLQWH